MHTAVPRHVSGPSHHHWSGAWRTQLAQQCRCTVLDAGQFDRVLGSLHCLPIGQRFSEMPNLYRQRPAAEVVREYLTEIPRLISGWDGFAVLAHIDYAVGYWTAEAGPFDPYAFEDEFRHALRALADSDRALEINTKRAPLRSQPVRPDRWLVARRGRQGDHLRQ